MRPEEIEKLLISDSIIDVWYKDALPFFRSYRHRSFHKSLPVQASIVPLTIDDGKSSGKANNVAHFFPIQQKFFPRKTSRNKNFFFAGNTYIKGTFLYESEKTTMASLVGENVVFSICVLSRIEAKNTKPSFFLTQPIAWIFFSRQVTPASKGGNLVYLVELSLAFLIHHVHSTLAGFFKTWRSWSIFRTCSIIQSENWRCHSIAKCS